MANRIKMKVVSQLDFIYNIPMKRNLKIKNKKISCTDFARLIKL